jgi:hypothetical protein
LQEEQAMNGQFGASSRALALVLWLGLGLVGCTGASPDPPPTSIVPIDKAKLVMAETNLKTDPVLAGCVIKVTAQNTLVVIDGDVPSETSKAKAEDLVLKVDGIKKVANHLRVVPTPGATEATPQ